MTKARLHIPAEVIQHNPNLIPLDKWQSNYVVNVLRMGCGDAITIFDGEGKEYSAILDEADDRVATLKITGQSASVRPAGPRIVCAVAIPKGKKMPTVIQKLSELDIDEIIPLITKRTVVDVKNKGSKQEKWHKVAVEAAKQSGRTVITEIDEPVSFDDFIRSADRFDLKLFAYENAGKNLRSVLQHYAVPNLPESVVLLIGPEGGFDPKEAKAAEKAGFHPFVFGKNILRCETAAIAFATILKYEFGV